MNDLQKAVLYITNNPTLSFHHVANKFNVNVSELHEAYRLSRVVEKDNK